MDSLESIFCAELRANIRSGARDLQFTMARFSGHVNWVFPGFSPGFSPGFLLRFFFWAVN